MSAITLTLLLPGKSIAVQSWTFNSEKVIRIGRASDNEVVLYSAVVSRRHVELRLENNGWTVINLGANGTYVEGKTIKTLPVEDDMVVRLASSGPKIKINLHPELSAIQKEVVRQSDITDGQKAESQGHNPQRPNPGDSKETIVNLS